MEVKYILSVREIQVKHAEHVELLKKLKITEFITVKFVNQSLTEMLMDLVIF